MTALQTRPMVSCPITARIPPSSSYATTVAVVERKRIIIVERQRIVAEDFAQAFEAAGAQVVGLASSVGAALALIARIGRVDGAVLDLHLQSGPTFPVASELVRRGIPFLFLTSCDARAIPDRFARIPRFEKPVEVNRVTSLLLA